MKTAKPEAFIRTTISLPESLRLFADDRAAADHAGNLSAYFRALMLPDYRRETIRSRPARKRNGSVLPANS